MSNGTTIRELSSVGSERLHYKQRVGGSTPSAPTKKDLFRIPEEVFFYVYVPPECYGKSWGKSKTDQASNLRSCFELFEMFFEVKNLQTNNSKQLLRVCVTNVRGKIKLQILVTCKICNLPFFPCRHTLFL